MTPFVVIHKVQIGHVYFLKESHLGRNIYNYISMTYINSYFL